MRLVRSTLLSIFLGACSVPALTLGLQAQIVLEVDVPPPPLPIYDQPPIPEPGWFWTPGYWSYDDEYGYFWVPGTWVEPPRAGLLWTPGYWGYERGNYRFFDGYWADHVGYYGGVDYGYGYTGTSYEGGYWEGGHLFYNRSVNNIGSVNITNVYSKTVIVNENGPRISFNGGQGGLNVRPTAQQEQVAHEQHVNPTPVQHDHVQMAGRDPSLRETQNKGRPPVAATARPNDFKGQGVVSAQSAGARPSGQTIPQGKANPAAPGSASPGAVAPAAPHNEQRQQSPAAAPNAQHPNTPEGEHRNAPNGSPAPSNTKPENTTAPETKPSIPAHGNRPERDENKSEKEAPRAAPREAAPRQERAAPAKPPAETAPRAEPQHAPIEAPRAPAESRPQQQMQPRPQAEPHPQAEPRPAPAQPRPNVEAVPHAAPQMPHPPGGGESRPEEHQGEHH